MFSVPNTPGAGTGHFSPPDQRWGRIPTHAIEWNMVRAGHSQHVLEEWIEATQILYARTQPVLTMWDKRDVVDTFSPSLAEDFGVWLDHADTHNILCSYGVGWWRDAYDREKPYSDCLRELDGYIWTGERYTGYDPNILTVRRPKGMDHKGIIIENGDKGDVAALLGFPAIIFDDKEAVVDLISTKGPCGSRGAVVRRGCKERQRVRRGYDICRFGVDMAEGVREHCVQCGARSPLLLYMKEYDRQGYGSYSSNSRW